MAGLDGLGGRGVSGMTHWWLRGALCLSSMAGSLAARQPVRAPVTDDPKVARPRLKPIHRRRNVTRGRSGRPSVAEALDLAATLQILQAGERLVVVSPAARAAIAVENECGILPNAAPRRSGCRSVWRSRSCGFGGESGLGAAATASRSTGGSSPKRARQPQHDMTGPGPALRTILKRPIRDRSGRRRSSVRRVRSRPVFGSHRVSTFTIDRRGRQPRETCRRSIPG